jgi:hypothetical protein
MRDLHLVRDLPIFLCLTIIIYSILMLPPLPLPGESFSIPISPNSPY